MHITEHIKTEIYDLLLEQLLIEGRYDDAAKKYPEAVEQTIDDMPVLKYFSKHDESGNNKYIMWMARQFADDLADRNRHQNISILYTK